MYRFKIRGPPWAIKNREGKDKSNRKKLNKPKTVVNSKNDVNIVNNRTCLYTNADQFKNKFSEFQVRIGDAKSKIIGITQIKPKKRNICT